MCSALVGIVLVGLGLLLYFTPIRAARDVVVVGLGAVTQDEVTAAAAVAPGLIDPFAASRYQRSGRVPGSGHADAWRHMVPSGRRTCTATRGSFSQPLFTPLRK